MNNESYYGVTRTDEYLAHYGIKGMKWGVRKARESGNSKALGRQYRKAQKKLAKLEARANNGKKYAKRAALLGAGAAAAGGVAAVGTGGLSSALGEVGKFGNRALTGASKGMHAGASALQRYANTRGAKTRGRLSALARGMHGAADATQTAATGVGLKAFGASQNLKNWGNAKSGIQTIAGRQMEAQGTKLLRNVRNAPKSTLTVGQRKVFGRGLRENARGMQYTNNQLLRAGAAALGAGLAGGAAYNAYRAATTKRAARKAAQFRSEMNKAFAGTQYDRRRKKNRRG